MKGIILQTYNSNLNLNLSPESCDPDADADEMDVKGWRGKRNPRKSKSSLRKSLFFVPRLI